MAFDRSIYKGAKLSTQQKKREVAEQQSFGGKKSPQWTFHRIEAGTNIFRILPPHDPSHPSFQPERKTFLKIEVDETDSNGNPTGKSEIKNKPIFIATVHGKDVNGEPLKSDPIDLYIKYVYRKANDEFQDDTEKEKFLAPITGFMSKGKFTAGIRPQTSYTYYAVKNGAVGRVQFNNQIAQRMEEISIANQDPNEPDDIDIFSDPDEGYPLVVDYNPKGKKGEKYNVYELKLQKGQTWDDFFSEHKVSDAVLKEFSELKPLKELYQDVYTLRDFNLALEGLQHVDVIPNKSLNGVTFDIFENEEFLEELEALKGLIKEAPKNIKEGEEEADNELKETFSKPKKSKVVFDDTEKEEGDDPESGDEFDDMDRSELKTYIKKNKLEIRLLKKYSDDDFREMIREKLAEVDKSTDIDEEEEDFDEPETDNTEEIAEKDIRARLAKLRKK